MVPATERTGVLAPQTAWRADLDGSPELVMLASALWQRLSGRASSVSLSQNVSAVLVTRDGDAISIPAGIKVDSFRRVGDELHLTGSVTSPGGRRYFASLRIDRHVSQISLRLAGPYRHNHGEAALS